MSGEANDGKRGLTGQSLDASEDGHPCEAALELRRVLRIRGLANEVPADVLDLCVSIAWIGKATSRTDRVAEFLTAGVDPNTWQVIAAVGRDRSLAARLLDIAEHGAPGQGMAAELAAIRRTMAFQSASEAVRRIADVATCAASGRRWLSLGNLCFGLVEIARVPDARNTSVVDIARYRSGRFRE